MITLSPATTAALAESGWELYWIGWGASRNGMDWTVKLLKPSTAQLTRSHEGKTLDEAIHEALVEADSIPPPQLRTPSKQPLPSISLEDLDL